MLKQTKKKNKKNMQIIPNLGFHDNQTNTPSAICHKKTP